VGGGVGGGGGGGGGVWVVGGPGVGNFWIYPLNA
jgi:hypothetical protein